MKNKTQASAILTMSEDVKKSHERTKRHMRKLSADLNKLRKMLED